MNLRPSFLSIMALDKSRNGVTPIEMVTGYKKKESGPLEIKIDRQEVDMDLFTDKQEFFLLRKIEFVNIQ